MYVSVGFISDKYPRDTYGDHRQRQNDQQIVVDDSFERMSGYKYFGIFDFDEFLTLAEGSTIREMMVHVLNWLLPGDGLGELRRKYLFSGILRAQKYFKRLGVRQKIWIQRSREPRKIL